VPDKQIHPLGTVAAPGDYRIADAAELLLKGAFATFDGSGAAGPFQPLLRIISDAGSVALETAADTTVAAGASADASWFPHIAAAAGAAPPPSGSGVQWAYIDSKELSVSCPPATSTRIPADATTFYTNAPSVYAAAASAGGVEGVSILADGHYYLMMTGTFASPPVATDVYNLIIEGGGTFADFGWQPASILFPIAGQETGSLFAGGLMSVGGFITPPTDAIVCRVDNTGGGHTLHFVYTGLFIMQLDTVNQDL
jgi:hypothetical protein